MARFAAGEGVAYTAGCTHARERLAEITAITDAAPDSENPRHVFVEKLFAGEGIRIVAMSQVERFAGELRMCIQRGGQRIPVPQPPGQLDGLRRRC